MEKLQIPGENPSDAELVILENRCRTALTKLRRDDSEVRVPLFVEFSGSPKSGKTTIIGILVHFFRRMGIDVVAPVEGASLRTPPGLRDDLLAFNAWSGCYALQHILIDSSSSPAPELVVLDRGLFDVAAWVEFLHITEQRIADEKKEIITHFFSLEEWRRRINAVFLFTADNVTSLNRENHSKLTKRMGAVMNPSTLEGLRNAYQTVADSKAWEETPLYHVDTSETEEKKISFQRVAYVVAERIVKRIEEASEQMLLVTESVGFQGFSINPKTIDQTVSKILNGNNPRFVERKLAEKDTSVQQIVPYAVLENVDGCYFWARRSSETRRPELRNKISLLVGGHAEQRDWDPKKPESVFETCLRRELEEELIGLQILKVEPVGFIHDIRSKMGQHHLAFIHKVNVGGRTAIRRQAIDQEFGRSPVSWKTADEIRGAIDEMDPWSQLAAHVLFNAKLAEDARQPVLFEELS